MVRHGCWLLQRFQPRTSNGLTPFEHVHGRRYRGIIFNFGECILARDTSGPTAKLTTSWSSCIWLGKCEVTDGHIVRGDQGIFITRNVRRLDATQQYNEKLLRQVLEPTWSPKEAAPAPEASNPAADAGTITMKAAIGPTPGCPGCVRGQRGMRHTKYCIKRRDDWLESIARPAPPLPPVEQSPILQQDPDPTKAEPVVSTDLPPLSSETPVKAEATSPSTTASASASSTSEPSSASPSTASSSSASPSSSAANAPTNSSSAATTAPTPSQSSGREATPSTDVSMTASALRRPASEAACAEPAMKRVRLVGKQPPAAGMINMTTFAEKIMEMATADRIELFHLMAFHEKPSTEAQQMISSCGQLFPKDKLMEGRRREMMNLAHFGVATLVRRDRLPKGTRIISTRWEEKWKGEDVRSRFVARDYRHLDPKREDIFAATPTDTGLLILLALAASKRHVIRTGDLTTAFMHADLQEEIYVEGPEGFIEDGWVWKLNKALNGLRRSPLDFQDFIAGVLTREMGFTRLTMDAMVFKHSSRDLVVDIHVDDPIALGPSNDVSWFFDTASKYMLLRADDEVKVGDEFKYLGRRYLRTESGFRRMAGAGYIEHTIELAGFRDLKPANTPGVASAKQSEEDPVLDESDHRRRLYPTVVGRLLFLAGDRPDIQYSVKELARTLHAPTEYSWAQLKRCLRYLQGTRDFCYDIKAGHELPEYIDVIVDANWATCQKTRKSTSGVHILWGGVLLRSLSRTQSTVALSSGESEFGAISLGIVESLYIKNFLAELGIDIKIRIFSDSSAGRAMIQRLGPGRLKHLEIKALYAQQTLKDHQIKVLPISTLDNSADLGTKYLPVDTHIKHCRRLGLYAKLFEDGGKLPP